MKRPPAFYFVAIFLGATCALPALAKAASEFSTVSRARALALVDLSVEAYGGLGAIRRAEEFSIRIVGTSRQLYANDAPDAVDPPDPFERTVVIETKKGRLFSDTKYSSQIGDYVFRTKEIIRDGIGHTIFVQDNTVAKMREPSLAGSQNLYQLLPQNILADVLRRRASLRWLGEDTWDGRKQKVVAYASRSGQVWNLFFDSKSHLLTRYTFFATKNVWGDSLNEFVFTGYRAIASTMVPVARTGYQGGRLKSEMRYREVSFEPNVDVRLYELPSGLTPLTLVEQKAEVLTLAPGVHLVRALAGGFNVLAVEFDEFVLVGEAPQEDGAAAISEEAIKLIRKTVPRKPIKYVVPTHYHHDHLAGIRAFISEGASVITTPGNVGFIRKIANATFTFSPDLLARQPREANIESMPGNKRIIGDKNQIVEIHQIGPIRHCREMLLLYLPKQKILFQSDLYNPISPEIPSADEDPWHGINPVDSRSLLESIRNLHLDVELIVGSHGRVSSMKELVKDSAKW